ncbi:pentapeptide repeat-containing protein [Gephyromycinifex aptenodytis]|uniref:pentapeptide repeat-containing protein n=1 Tax=Gephyromycinifex aptenodytis TaxID=2716227 RepID=UPI00144666C3|nr:pentapeptide repeat-containing protein [Gephyromycinifex aptenodytis]
MRPELQADCSRCVGLCCTALPFARSADFPEDKPGAVPCRNLDQEYRCTIHPRLRQEGWIGCTVFECFGAGQRVTQSLGGQQAWLSKRKQMYPLFPVMHQLHEMLWYLADPVVTTSSRAGVARDLAGHIDALAASAPEGLLALEVPAIRARVGSLLGAVSEETRTNVARRGVSTRRTRACRRLRPGADLVGADLSGVHLQGCSLRGALLLRARLHGAVLYRVDLLGADLRGAEVSGADLREALFLTQPQVNAATGDSTTRLPARLHRPRHWS